MFTLEDFFQLKDMADAKIINQSFIDSSCVIEYISVQEPPVEDFIRENEIVLSTAIGLKDEISLLFFIQNVHESKAAALILALNSDSNQIISQKIIDYININQFPLIIIPWEVRFSDIISSVMEVLQQQKDEQENKYIKLQKELLHTYFNGDSLEKAAELIAKAIGRSIIIRDKDRNTKGCFMIKGKELHEENFREIRIGVSDYLYGYLSVQKSSNDKKNSINLSFFHFYINVPLSLWFEKEEVVNTTSLNIRNDFVWKLSNVENNPKKLLSEGIQLGFNMDLTYLCVLLQIHEGTAIGSYTNNFLSIESQMIELIKEHNIQTMISLKNNTFIIFLEYKPTLNLSSLLDKIENDILKNYSGYSFTWGVGEKPHTKFTFFDQYTKAQIALEQALYLKLPRLTFKKSRISSMVNQMVSREEIMEQALKLFKPIESNPRFNEKGMDLINTVTVYLRTNYNTCQTSRILNIHRQSLLYRLDKFEELIELSLKDNDDLFLIQYYLRILGKFSYE